MLSDQYLSSQSLKQPHKTPPEGMIKVAIPFQGYLVVEKLLIRVCWHEFARDAFIWDKVFPFFTNLEWPELKDSPYLFKRGLYSHTCSSRKFNLKYINCSFCDLILSWVKVRSYGFDEKISSTLSITLSSHGVSSDSSTQKSSHTSISTWLNADPVLL